jgi:hypothetical protein
MKKYTRILVALMFLLGLGVAANAQTQPVIAASMPFEFVAGKTTLPAGAYVVKRISAQPFDVLMITSRDNGTSVFVNPTEMEDASTYKPNMSFRKVGEQHVLSQIKRIGATPTTCASLLKACCITVHYAPPQPGRGAVDL